MDAIIYAEALQTSTIFLFPTFNVPPRFGQLQWAEHNSNYQAGTLNKADTGCQQVNAGFVELLPILTVSLFFFSKMLKPIYGTTKGMLTAILV